MSEATDGTTFTIAHLSDLHCGGQYFVPGLLERAISEINDLAPDIVVCSGDLTTFAVAETLLIATAMIACLVPSYRATRVDPVVALRAE